MATWSLPSITQCCLSLVYQEAVISHYKNTTSSLRCLSLLLLLRHFVRKNTLTPVAAVHILSIFYKAQLASSVICLLHYFIMNGYPTASRGKEIAVRKVLNILHILHSELLVCLVVVCFHPVYNCDLCLCCWLKIALISVASNLTLNATFFFVSRTTSQVFVSWVILLDTKMPIYDIVWLISSSNRVKMHVEGTTGRS